MNSKAMDAYEEKYKTTWASAPTHHQNIWLEAWNAAIGQAIAVIETYRVSVGNSASGELAAEWTMNNLREVRDELHALVACGHD